MLLMRLQSTRKITPPCLPGKFETGFSAKAYALMIMCLVLAPLTGKSKYIYILGNIYVFKKYHETVTHVYAEKSWLLTLYSLMLSQHRKRLGIHILADIKKTNSITTFLCLLLKYNNSNSTLAVRSGFDLHRFLQVFGLNT